MKISPTPVSVSLDSETGEMTLIFRNGAEDDNPDPVAFTPDSLVTVIISGATITSM